jgi:hypothetical protein
MFDGYSDGYCAQCALGGLEVEMLLNRGDYWECPGCRLQMAGNAGQVMILRVRGRGEFRSDRTLATEHVVGAWVRRQRVDDPLGFGAPFMDEAELRRFLATEVTES